MADWASILIGGVITFVVSLIFYVPAARSLRRESAKLRHDTTLILRSLEEAGLVELTRDDETDGITGMKIKASGSANTESRASGTPTVERGEPPTDPG